MPPAPTAAGLGAALTLAGLGFGSPSLLIPGIGMVVLAVVAVLWVELATPARLLRAPGPARVEEEEPFRLEIRAVGSRLPLPGGELTDPVLSEPIAVGPRWRRRVEGEVRLRGRGRRALEPARLVVRDPLALRTRVVTSAPAGELLVLPRVDPVLVGGRGARGAGLVAGLEDDGAGASFDARAIELEVDGLRPHREGSPASRIHWPTVARTGELVERRLVAGADTAPLVVLDASRPASPDALDSAVRAAGSLCRHLARAGGCAVLLPGDRRPTEVAAERGWAHVHTRLALVQATAGPPAVGRVQRAGAVFWVSARARPSLPTPLRAGSSARYLVGPHVSGPGGPALVVSGCEGRRIGARGRAPMERAA